MAAFKGGFFTFTLTGALASNGYYQSWIFGVDARNRLVVSPFSVLVHL